MLKDKKKEIEDMARKAVRMEPQSIRTLIFAADILLARDQMEREMAGYCIGQQLSGKEEGESGVDIKKEMERTPKKNC